MEYEHLEQSDIDVLDGMMSVFFTGAELCMQKLENHFRTMHDLSNDYNRLVKEFGKFGADEIVMKVVGKMIRHDEKRQVGRLLEQFKRTHTLMGPLTDVAITVHKDGIANAEMFNSIQYDANWLCNLYARIANCQSQETFLKIDSLLKLDSGGGKISQRVIDRFII